MGGMNRKLCNIVRKMPSDDVKKNTRQIIADAHETQTWEDIVICEPLLPIITHNANVKYRKYIYDLFLRSFTMELQLSLETDAAGTSDKTRK